MKPSNALESDFLVDEREAILSAAVRALHGAYIRHYAADPDEMRLRLEKAYDAVVTAFRDDELTRVIELGGQLAHRRYEAGYDLSEVQTALNTLEEAIWQRAFSRLSPAGFARVITPASTILGAMKDSLAREYVTLATRSQAPALDLPALFAGPS